MEDNLDNMADSMADDEMVDDMADDEMVDDMADNMVLEVNVVVYETHAVH